MELVIYFVSAWLSAAYLVTTIHKDEIVRSIVLYFVFTMLTMCSFTFIYLNLRYIDINGNIIKFLAIAMCRFITTPFLTLIFINSYYRLITYKKIGSIILLISLTTLLEYLNLKLQVISYIRWSFGYTFLFTVLSSLAALIINKGIIVIQLRGDYK